MPEIPHSGVYTGKDAVTRFFGDLGGALDVTSFDPATYLASGDEVMTTGAWSCVARSTCKAFTAQWAMRFLLRDGKVCFAHVYKDSPPSPPPRCADRAGRALSRPRRGIAPRRIVAWSASAEAEGNAATPSGSLTCAAASLATPGVRR